jgi:hypothetical protein
MHLKGEKETGLGTGMVAFLAMEEEALKDWCIWGQVGYGMGGHCAWKELGDVRSSLGAGRGSSHRGACPGAWSLYWRCILLKYTEGHHIRHDTDRSIPCLKGRHSGEMGESMRRKDKAEENGVRVQL